MAHWRDGGIGNMAGSDDRPIEEWTLLERLAAGHIYAEGDTTIAQLAFDEIQRLREAPIDAAIAQTADDRNAVIKECIDALECQLAKHEKSNEAQGILHAMEFLETLKTPKNGGAA